MHYIIMRCYKQCNYAVYLLVLGYLLRFCVSWWFYYVKKLWIFKQTILNNNNNE